MALLEVESSVLLDDVSVLSDDVEVPGIKAGFRAAPLLILLEELLELPGKIPLLLTLLLLLPELIKESLLELLPELPRDEEKDRPPPELPLLTVVNVYNERKRMMN